MKVAGLRFFHWQQENKSTFSRVCLLKSFVNSVKEICNASHLQRIWIKCNVEKCYQRATENSKAAWLRVNGSAASYSFRQFTAYERNGTRFGKLFRCASPTFPSPELKAAACITHGGISKWWVNLKRVRSLGQFRGLVWWSHGRF